MKHKHAYNMLAYAQDAQETDKPWELWECKDADPNIPQPWEKLTNHPFWNNDTEYRRKPRTIRIGNYDVPEPLRVAPEINTDYFYPAISNGQTLAVCCSYNNGTLDAVRIKYGFCHLKKESAELHAKALISLTEQ